MAETQKLGGEFTFPGTQMTVKRMGYGAMRLTGPHIMGPPKDRAEAVAVLREAVESGVNHIDTAEFYGPHAANEIIREALHPYKDGLVIVTKVGAVRSQDGGWHAAQSPAELTQAVHENLRSLGVDALDIVNFRAWTGQGGPVDQPLDEQFSALAKLQQQGLIKHLGVSTVTAKQVVAAQKIAPVVCVQNEYNLAERRDEALIDELAKQGIAYVTYFPLGGGGMRPVPQTTLEEVAQQAGATPMQVALAWQLHRADNVLLIPGTSSRVHLRENLAAAELQLSAEQLRKLDAS